MIHFTGNTLAMVIPNPRYSPRHMCRRTMSDPTRAMPCLHLRQSWGRDCTLVLTRSRGYTIAQESAPARPLAATDARSSSQRPPAPSTMPSYSRHHRQRGGRSADLAALYKPREPGGLPCRGCGKPLVQPRGAMAAEYVPCHAQRQRRRQSHRGGGGTHGLHPGLDVIRRAHD
jgi:hypothetical protein